MEPQNNTPKKIAQFKESDIFIEAAKGGHSHGLEASNLQMMDNILSQLESTKKSINPVISEIATEEYSVISPLFSKALKEFLHKRPQLSLSNTEIADQKHK